MKDLIRKAFGGPPAGPGERFKDRVAVVTGASAGIGLATAIAFAREGAKVALLARREDESARALEKVRAAGSPESIFIQTDVSNTAQVQAAFRQIQDTFGRVDVALNNAGAMHPGGPMATLSEADFDRIMAVNVKGVWLCMREEIQLMEKHAAKDGAAIVNMSSIWGMAGIPKLGFYAASKHAVIGLTRSAALDYAARGIRINAICPGYVRTDMTKAVEDASVKARVPQGRMSDPEETAAAVLWMCSDEARFLVGHSLVLDGGTLTR
ncbi:MAG TPA: glucose 1-dehydrogenase [Candidatus Krumholzibacteria bacterium]|nr:glucose 1-dehydrogenase [Candidatus Krumholzibacteria bacterium]